MKYNLNKQLKRRCCRIRNDLFVLLLTIFFTQEAIGEPKLSLEYMTEDYPPYSFLDNGRLTGVSVEMLRLIWKKSKMEPQPISLLPWARALHKLKNSNNSVLFPMARTDERAELFNLACGEPNPTSYAFIALKTKKIVIKTFQELKNYQIGTIRGDLGEDILISRSKTQENLISNVSIDYIIRMLTKERIHMMFYHENALNPMLSSRGYNPQDFEIVFRLPVSQSCYAFSKDVSPTFVKQFESTLRAISKTQSYRDLIGRFVTNTN